MSVCRASVTLRTYAARHPVKTMRKQGQKYQRGNPASVKRRSRLLVQKTPKRTRPYSTARETLLLPGWDCASRRAAPHRTATNTEDNRNVMRPSCCFKIELGNRKLLPSVSGSSPSRQLFGEA